jgi:hypothetical protein
MNLSFLIIQDKAVSLFKDLKLNLKAQEEGVANAEDLEFKASYGSLERFKTCGNLHSLHISGERVSADVAAAKKFLDEFLVTIEGGGYLPKQNFSVDEMGYFGRGCLPEHLFLNKKGTRCASE